MGSGLFENAAEGRSWDFGLNFEKLILGRLHENY